MTLKKGLPKSFYQFRNIDKRGQYSTSAALNLYPAHARTQQSIKVTEGFNMIGRITSSAGGIFVVFWKSILKRTFRLREYFSRHTGGKECVGVVNILHCV